MWLHVVIGAVCTSSCRECDCEALVVGGPVFMLPLLQGSDVGGATAHACIVA